MVSGVSGALLTADSELGSVVVVPGGRLCGAGVSQGVALGRRGGNGGPIDCPGHFLGIGGLVAPLVPLFGCECRNIGAGVGSLRDTAQFQGVGVETVPGGALFAPIIGQGAVLGGDGADSKGKALDGLQGRVSGFLRLLRGGLRGRGRCRGCRGRSYRTINLFFNAGQVCPGDTRHIYRSVHACTPFALMIRTCTERACVGAVTA